MIVAHLGYENEAGQKLPKKPLILFSGWANIASFLLI
jgi:hypothetical protein